MKRALVAVAVTLAAALVVLVAEPLFHDSGRTAGSAADEERRVGGVAAASRSAAMGGNDEETAVLSSSDLIGGRVHDAAGKGIAGAAIRIVPWSARTRGPEGAPATTDDSGSFEIEAAGDTVFALCAEAAGYSPQSVDRVRGGELVDIELVPAATIDGLVMDAESTPVADASIKFLATLGGVMIERTARSDAAGRFRLADLPGRSEAPLLSAVAAGFAPYLNGDLSGPALEGSTRMTIVMRPGATVSGRVLDAVTDAPIADARVRVKRTGWFNRTAAASVLLDTGPEAVCDAAGAFRLAQVPDSIFGATVALSASAPGHVDALEVLSNLGDGREVRTEVRLWPGGSIRGRVVDTRGRPVAGVSVAVDSWSWLLGADADAATDRAPCLSGPDGEYRLECVAVAPHGVPVLAKRLTGQHAWGMLDSVRVTAGEPTRAPDLVVKVAPAAVLRVVAADGRPVVGALVEVADQEVREWFTRGDGRVLVSFARDAEKTRGVAAFARVSAPGYVDLETSAFVPDVDAPPEVVVTLARASELRCRVQWGDGHDAAGIPVAVARGDVPISAIWPLRNEVAANLEEDPSLALVETDARGRCRIKGLPRGPWHVAAWREARDAEPAVRIASVTDASREVVLALEDESPPPAAAVETTDVDVTVVYSDSRRPVLDATVYVENVQALPVGPGVFRRARVPRARIAVSAWARECPKTIRRNVDLRLPGSEKIELRVESGIRVRGRAVLPAGMSLTGASVYATFGGGGRNASLEQSGAFELAGVPTGVDLSLFIQGSPRGQRDLLSLAPRSSGSFHVPEGVGALDLGEVEFVPASSVQVRIYDRRAGRPNLQPWDLTLRALDGTWTRERTIPGYYASIWLPWGEVIARCEVPGADPVVKTATFEGFSTNLEFTLR